MVWFDAKLLTRREVAGTVHAELQVPAPVRASFVAPGQYVLVKTGALQGPFAPASAPGVEGPLELLFKPGTPLTDALEALPVGATLQVTAATGPGFPLEVAKGKRLLLIASGTGQAPMRSVIEAVRVDRGAYRSVTLLLGVRDRDHLAFESDEPAWLRDGIEVHVTLSRGDSSWAGRKGRVQLHLPEGPLADTVAFLVGQREMVAEVVEQLQARGVPRAQIFLNL
ncbi:MAG: NAD-binding oxidoreductase [Archangiaceae bacterium]|nr:NAD-binding oxidoreductase [Archangiaceae bacterium]